MKTLRQWFIFTTLLCCLFGSCTHYNWHWCKVTREEWKRLAPNTWTVAPYQDNVIIRIYKVKTDRELLFLEFPIEFPRFKKHHAFQSNGLPERDTK